MGERKLQTHHLIGDFWEHTVSALGREGSDFLTAFTLLSLSTCRQLRVINHVHVQASHRSSFSPQEKEEGGEKTQHEINK